MAGMTADAVYVLLGNEIVLLTEKIEEMGGWEPLEHKGTVQTAEDLPADAKKGWMYNIATDSIYGAAGMNVVMTSEGWDSMGPIINMGLYLTKEEGNKTFQPKGNYLSGTDVDLKESGKAADAKATGDKFTEMSADISKKLDKNQGSENSGKIAGINETGDIVPMFPVGVDYNEETNCLEFGSDQKMKLNQGIGLDNTLTKTGSAADAGVTGKEINSLKESLSNKITKFYASNQGETHLADSDDGKIMDMMLYGKSEQKQYSGKNLFDVNDIGGPFPLSADTNGWYIIEMSNAGSNIVYKNITTKPSNKLKPSTLYTIITETEYLEEALVCVSSTYPSNVIEFKGQINADVEIKKMGISKATATTVDDFSNSDTLLRTFVRIDPGKTAKAKFRISIVEGDATENSNWEYEPYTGGIPSPNPDYPQEIKSVVNPTVKVCGKNLLNIASNRNTNYTSLADVLSNSVTDTITYFALYICKNSWDSSNLTKIYNASIQNQGHVSVTFTLDDDCEVFVKHNGKSKDIRLFSLPLRKGTYTISFDCDGIYASAVGGLILSNIQIELGSTPTAYEPYHEQTVTFPYTLNGVEVTSGGNIAINGKQYVSDYFDVERGKLVRMCKEIEKITSDFLKTFNFNSSNESIKYAICNGTLGIKEASNPVDDCYALCSHFKPIGWNSGDSGTIGVNIVNGDMRFYFGKNSPIATLESAKQFFEDNEVYISGVLKVPKEIDLTPEEIAALKTLATYYPATNISVNSEQLDGYTVFNYPISMENGWNYVKQQIGDTREYVYNMNIRTQDADLQAAEAYVNSEYAVALTELEVM